jgi:hypothetical protein
MLPDPDKETRKILNVSFLVMFQKKIDINVQQDNKQLLPAAVTVTHKTNIKAVRSFSVY